MGDAGLEACSLRAFWNKPAHFCPQENVLFSECLFWPVSLPAKHLHLFFPFIVHTPLLDRPNSHLLRSPLFPSTQESLSVAGLWRTDGIRNVKSACVLTQRIRQSFTGGSTIFLLGVCVFLSAHSWNYLGAKLIALDPTSHCNRLSANLGFSRCSQVSLGQRGCTEQPTALFSWGFDL